LPVKSRAGSADHRLAGLRRTRALSGLAGRGNRGGVKSVSARAAYFAGRLACLRAAASRGRIAPLAGRKGIPPAPGIQCNRVEVFHESDGGKFPVHGYDVSGEGGTRSTRVSARDERRARTNRRYQERNPSGQAGGQQHCRPSRRRPWRPRNTNWRPQ